MENPSRSEPVPLRRLSFTVAGQARPKGSKFIRYTKEKRPYLVEVSKELKAWMDSVSLQARAAMGPNVKMEGPVRLELAFYTPRPRSHYRSGQFSSILRDGMPERPLKRPDLTKLTRGVEDALVGVIFQDDAQVVEQATAKYWGDARVEVTVWNLSSADARVAPSREEVAE